YTPRAISPEEVTHVSETGRVRAGAGPRGGRGRVGGPGPGAEARREGAGRPVERHRLPHPGRDAHRVRPEGGDDHQDRVRLVGQRREVVVPRRGDHVHRGGDRLQRPLRRRDLEGPLEGDRRDGGPGQGQQGDGPEAEEEALTGGPRRAPFAHNNRAGRG